MSLDAEYLFSYDYGINDDSLEDFIHRDREYLENEFGGEFQKVTKHLYYWDKPKYTLSPSDLDMLEAEQIMERRDFEDWEIILKPKFIKSDSDFKEKQFNDKVKYLSEELENMKKANAALFEYIARRFMRDDSADNAELLSEIKSGKVKLETF